MKVTKEFLNKVYSSCKCMYAHCYNAPSIVPRKAPREDLCFVDIKRNMVVFVDRDFFIEIKESSDNPIELDELFDIKDNNCNLYSLFNGEFSKHNGLDLIYAAREYSDACNSLDPTHYKELSVADLTASYKKLDITKSNVSFDLDDGNKVIVSYDCFSGITRLANELNAPYITIDYVEDNNTVEFYLVGVGEDVMHDPRLEVYSVVQAYDYHPSLENDLSYSGITLDEVIEEEYNEAELEQESKELLDDIKSMTGNEFLANRQGIEGVIAELLDSILVVFKSTVKCQKILRGDYDDIKK
ncbi:MAG: hypothetical protein ACRCX2_28640 [Paraclostridium sp.]